MTDVEAILPGQVLFITAGESEFCGVAASDGAVIYLGESGYIVMSYLDMMDVDAVFAASVAD